MGRLLAVGVVALVIDVFALIDLWMIDGYRVKVLNKTVWTIIIVLVPVVGAILWFFVGRGRANPGRRGRRTVAPDDDPEFLRRLDEQLDDQPGEQPGDGSEAKPGDASGDDASA